MTTIKRKLRSMCNTLCFWFTISSSKCWCIVTCFCQKIFVKYSILHYHWITLCSLLAKCIWPNLLLPEWGEYIFNRQLSWWYSPKKHWDYIIKTLCQVLLKVEGGYLVNLLFILQMYKPVGYCEGTWRRQRKGLLSYMKYKTMSTLNLIYPAAVPSSLQSVLLPVGYTY